MQGSVGDCAAQVCEYNWRKRQGFTPFGTREEECYQHRCAVYGTQRIEDSLYGVQVSGVCVCVCVCVCECVCGVCESVCVCYTCICLHACTIMYIQCSLCYTVCTLYVYMHVCIHACIHVSDYLKYYLGCVIQAKLCSCLVCAVYLSVNPFLTGKSRLAVVTSHLRILTLMTKRKWFRT